VTYEATAEEIIRLFGQWKQAAALSLNAKVSIAAPLEPPTMEEATALLPRLRGIHEEQENNDVDLHGHPIGDRPQAAMGQLWEEWRDDKLDVWNGYRNIWTGPDPLYDSPKQSH
jgi:hypothetical protein